MIRMKTLTQAACTPATAATAATAPLPTATGVATVVTIRLLLLQLALLQQTRLGESRAEELSTLREDVLEQGGSRGSALTPRHSKSAQKRRSALNTGGEPDS